MKEVARAPWARTLAWTARRTWPLGFLMLAGTAAAMLAAAQDQVATPAVPAAATVASVPLLRVSGPIGPATADYIARGLQKAARDRTRLVVLQIDTPGGLDSSTRQIVKDILASKVPVVAWMRLHGERWRVTSATPLHPGQRVRVSGRAGLVLQVEPDL